ncbi:conserved hypothetical protein [Vibrio chagasii]|nr:conserved hypothetical protein [Vibrio chagasii]CAH7155617.1 conserved hypothetical protein [Vibrio chagasii]CAH7210494.1 conserved hypothetical protein [Vibrio chagasii]
MSIIVANGAVKNSGDFLIRDSFLDFFDKNITANYESILYQKLVDTELENKTIVFSGGPVFEHKFQNALSRAAHHNCNYVFFGAGSYLFNYSKSFSKLNTPVKSKHLAVRDYLTKDIFELDKAVVTGCSASYKRDSMNYQESNGKVAISAPQRYDYFPYTLSLIDYFISQGYSISVLFNRGWDRSEYTSGLTQIKTEKFVKKLMEMNIEVIDASGKHGMAKYDGYAMHIGFRLHSHYYFLQNGLPSKLLVEDSRGLGSNLLLGDDVIWPYASDINMSKINTLPSKLSAIIFRTVDSFNIRKVLTRQDTQSIDQFLTEPKSFIEKQNEIELAGCDFLQEALNGL